MCIHFFWQYSEYIFVMNVLNFLVNGHMETNAAK